MSFDEKKRQFEAFWAGKGPSLILIRADKLEQYDTDGYVERFHNPEKMWEAEIKRAQVYQDWPTDGVGTVRPNLGTVFVPAMVGQGYKLSDGQMPWPGEHMSEEAIRANRNADIAASETGRLAAEFYRIHAERSGGNIKAYLPDTQGVFDIAHLLYGNDIFYEMPDPARREWIDELMEISLRFYIDASKYLKGLIGEESNWMWHGHAGGQGVFFPEAGVRISEDTATLLSPAMIDDFILPAIKASAQPFGKAFVHYCGRHEYLHEKICEMGEVCALDLGNPEMYDTRWRFELHAKTGTVCYGRVAREGEEDWKTYIRRLGGLVRQTGARCILMPEIFPKSREDCQKMLDIWHELTDSG